MHAGTKTQSSPWLVGAARHRLLCLACNLAWICCSRSLAEGPLPGCNTRLCRMRSILNCSSVRDCICREAVARRLLFAHMCSCEGCLALLETTSPHSSICAEFEHSTRDETSERFARLLASALPRRFFIADVSRTNPPCLVQGSSNSTLLDKTVA